MGVSRVPVEHLRTLRDQGLICFPPVHRVSGERVKNFRSERAMTVTQLAEEAELPREAVSAIESGRLVGPDDYMLNGLADALGVEVSRLRGMEPKEGREALLYVDEGAVRKGLRG